MYPDGDPDHSQTLTESYLDQEPTFEYFFWGDDPGISIFGNPADKQTNKRSIKCSLFGGGNDAPVTLLVPSFIKVTADYPV